MGPKVVPLCTTQPGAYGTAAKSTEVPQAKLLAALEAKLNGRFAPSDQ